MTSNQFFADLLTAAAHQVKMWDVPVHKVLEIVKDAYDLHEGDHPACPGLEDRPSHSRRFACAEEFMCGAIAYEAE